jgi:serine/threonine protein kinase
MSMIGQLLTGRYLILEKLGTGGFSETYLARDKYLPQHPLCVVKCLKLPSTSKISIETAQRLFDSEARVMERLGRHHSQIPRLLAYCHEQAQVYLVQDYIDGENLAKWVARGQQLSTKGAISLLSDLLQVLDYLHAHRVIHRDIKPSNVMRRRRDGKMVLIDFGAACLLPEDATPEDVAPEDAVSGDPNAKLERDHLSLTIGTPGYMPDEQCLGMAQFNSDLYALGMLVIYLLTGVKPQKFQQNLISGELDWQQFLPQKPIQAELIAILERMVRTKFSDRYQHVAEVLNDLQALSHTQRSERQETLVRSRKVLRRVLVAAVISVAIGGGGGYVYAHNQKAGGLLNRIGQRLSPSNIHLTQLQDLPMQSNVEQMAIAPNDSRLITASRDHQLRFWSLPQGELVGTVSGHTATTAIAISRDSKLLVTGGADGLVRIWDADSGRFLQALRGQQAITAVAISPDAQTLISGEQDGTIQQWQIQTGSVLHRLKVPQASITAIAYGATPDQVISASSDRQIQVWNLQTSELRRTFAGHTDEIRSLQMFDDSTLVSGGDDRILLWDLKREELASVISDNSLRPTTTAIYQQRLITLHENGALQLWQRNANQPANQLVSQGKSTLNHSSTAALSPNLNYIASWHTDRLRIWKLDTNH